MNRQREQWVRPPVVAREPGNAAFAKWRFRIISGVFVAAFGLFMLIVFLRVSNVAEEDPGLFGTLGSVPGAAATATSAGPAGR